MFRYLVQPVRKAGSDAPLLEVFKAVTQGFYHGLGLRLACESGQIGGKPFGFAVADVQGHAFLMY
jgi:hypothetical protein